MHPRFLLLWFLLLGTFSSALAQDHDLWQPQDEKAWLAAHHLDAKTARRGVLPGAYRTLRVDRQKLWQRLQAAPREFSADARQRTMEISLPLSKTAFARFSVQESPVLEDKLAARHPDLRTYVAQGIDDPSLTARLDLTPQGFHALILSPLRQIYIDPYAPEDPDLCIVFAKRDYAGSKPFHCLVQGQKALSPEVLARAEMDELARPTGGNLRTYRLAVAATAEYTQAAGGGTVLGALGAIITTVNRVSAVFEKDLAIRLKLVVGEESIIFTDSATDGFSNSAPNTLINESQAKIDAVIGTANYDIGHTFSTGAGGLAGLGVVCRSGQKARGVTGTSSPVGDPYDIDYVIHEMGHQFGANHPFNGTTGSCTGSNRNAATAYEPGSGTTIMAYAGICSPQNLAPHSDDYFHTISYDEIDTYTSTGAGGGCPVVTATGNNPPSLNTLANYTIPQGTPFALTAQAADADGDVLTYCWEEFDKGAAQDPTANPRDNATAPLFRSYAPTVSSTRLFPSLTYILNYANVPPAILGGLATGEFLPATNRTLTFRVTARDNHPGGGGASYASLQVTATTAAGPFALTSPNAVATFAGGAAVPITWNVASTTASPVSCASVKISLSTDGGQTFPFVLAASTPNDGAETVTLPVTANAATTQGRIKIEAVDNIFFDLSDAALTITSSNTAPTVSISRSLTITRGTPTAATATVGTASDANGNPLSVAVSNLPDGVSVTASLSGGSINLTGTADCRLTTTTTSRTYPITVTVADSFGSTTAATVNLIVQPNPTPTLGTYNNPATVSGAASIVATPSTGVADANGNLPASAYTVSPTALAGGGTATIDQSTGAVTISTTAATTPGTYPIRVTAQDSCGAAVVRGFSFTLSASVAPAFTSALPPSAATVDVAYSHTFTATGSPAPQFMLVSGTLPPGLALNQTTGVLSGTPATPQIHPGISVSAGNGTNPPATQTFSITVGNRFSHYIAAYGFSPGSSVNTADPDADGLNNLLEYALNLNAASNDSVAGRPTVSTELYSGTPYLTIKYPRLTTDTDLDYIAQVSSDLITWSNAASSLQGAATSGPGFVAESGTAPLLSVIVRDTVPATANLRFIRLQVIQH